MDLRASYRSMFYITFAFVGIFACSSLTSIWYLSVLFKVLAVILALFLSFKTLVGMTLPRDYDLHIFKSFSPYYLLLFPIGLLLLLCVYYGSLSLLSVLNYTNLFQKETFFLDFITFALVPAIVEELFCRYIFIGFLAPFNTIGGVIASSIFFSLLHGNFLQMPVTFVGGMLLGLIFVFTRSLLPCFIFHFLYNLILLVLSYYPSYTSLTFLILGSLSICSLFTLFWKKQFFIQTFQAIQTTILKKRTVVSLMFSSPLIIFILLFVFEAILSLFS